MKSPAAFFSVLALITSSICFQNAGFCAEGIKPEAHGVTLRVRAIRAKGLVGKDSSKNAAQNPLKANSVRVDEGLTDLTAKLEQLPYRKYRMVMSREVLVALKQKQVVRLQGGQQLNVRLLYANAERVGMWVHWTDKDGASLIDTRLHFTSAEAMLTGTDSSKNCAVILALDVVPAAAAGK